MRVRVRVHLLVEAAQGHAAHEHAHLEAQTAQEARTLEGHVRRADDQRLAWLGLGLGLGFGFGLGLANQGTPPPSRRAAASPYTPGARLAT